tara:strand:+ start:102 stop:491 length:390 start_codon:yes stop_codon:yes gene_type:complete
MSENNLNETVIEPASIEEMEIWNEYLKREQPKSIDIPYAFSVGAVNIGGIVHVKNPIEDSSVEGVALGVINGSFRLDKNKQRAKLYDPTGSLLRLVVELKIPSSYLRARVDTRRWDGKWNKGSWAYVRF